MDTPSFEATQPKSAIEIAREYGVDIEHLYYMRRLTPLQRLQHLESALNFIYAARQSIKRQREALRHGRTEPVSKNPSTAD